MDNSSSTILRLIVPAFFLISGFLIWKRKLTSIVAPFPVWNESYTTCISRWQTATLAGDFKVTNDELADALLSIARDRKNRQNCVWDDLVTACSCPDGDNPSMHIAATYFLLAEELPKSWTGTHSLSSSFAVVPGNRS